MERKIIQVSATPETECAFFTVIALCSDGTVWITWPNSNEDWEDWRVLPSIPQSEETH